MLSNLGTFPVLIVEIVVVISSRVNWTGNADVGEFTDFSDFRSCFTFIVRARSLIATMWKATLFKVIR